MDDQFAPLAEKIETALHKLNSGKLRFLLNTHFHGDHTGVNACFGGKGADIIAHANVRKRLADKSGAKPVELPVLTFKQSASVHLNGDKIEKAIAEGKTLEQIKAAGVPEKYKDWGGGFINNSRWLEITYNGLTKK